MNPNLKPGDLIMIENHSKSLGIIVTEGLNMSVYVEGRPIKIIDTYQHVAISKGKRIIVYDYQVRKLCSAKGESLNV